MGQKDNQGAQALMQKLVTGMTNNRGFTLIEIMIVIVIIGITIGFALIAFGDFGESKRILFAADHLKNTLRLAQQQTILETSTLGLKIDNTGYQFLQLQNNAHWTPLSNTGVFKMTYFPKNTSITLQIANPPAPNAPAIILNASGDMTPFTLTFGNAKENKIALLTGHRNGDLEFHSLGEQ
jgi:general secretion pathway protein H